MLDIGQEVTMVQTVMQELRQYPFVLLPHLPVCHVVEALYCV